MPIIEEEVRPGRAVLARQVDGFAMALGVACFFAASGILILIPSGIYLDLIEERVRSQTRIYRLTGFDQAMYRLLVVGVAAITGAIGLALARRGGRPRKRASLAASAARFSAWGLATDGLILAVNLAALGYHWLMWG